MITRVPHHKIDKQKWDATILNSTQAEIYALSWFLDTVSPNWGALIYNDYEAVMPLPIKKKYNVTYIVQPPFCQKLGVFSAKNLPTKIQSDFVKKLKKFVSVRYSTTSQLANDKACSTRPNLILNLEKTEEELQANFNSNCKRNIKKGIKNNIECKKISASDFSDFYQSSFSYTIPASFKNAIQSLLINAEANNSLECIVAMQNDEITSGVAFFKIKGRYYYLLASSTQNGKSNGSMFSIINSFIEAHAGETAILDFEGSDIEGVAKFYKGFGAQPEPYYYFDWHRLPFISNFIKT